ncbi:CRISPR-associated endonuclease Cas2 [Streptococcus sobrinus]|uniref:CRISPR-associated endonuclease Cas2 n=1 Tax=Streptococcus sobrinus TaxID=1310 RepID=UPI0002F0F5E6|nr:CRISPR-associated endonuclease Cas2 [Streptococcus sobrinus]
MGCDFNLTVEELLFARNYQLYCLVIYDIANQKRRLKLARLLEGYGKRVQRSCFEVKLSQKVYRRLLQALEDFYEEDEKDCITLYKIRREERVVFNSYDEPEEETQTIIL